jgi:restriction endonuclease
MARNEKRALVRCIIKRVYQMAYIQTIGGAFIPQDYFTQENIEFISKKATEMVNKDISTHVVFTTQAILNVLQRVLEQRLESVPKMNQRALMYLVNDYLDYQVEANRNLWWADAYIVSQRLFDPSVRRGVISNWTVKTNPKKTPTTARFYFT